MKIHSFPSLLGLLTVVTVFSSTPTLKAELSAEDKKAVEAQTKDYPLTTCLISEDPLGGEMGAPVDYLYKGKDGKSSPRLIRFCCKSCIKSFQKDPEKYLKMIEEAKNKKSPESTPKTSGTSGQ